jgi:hypothetical protein
MSSDHRPLFFVKTAGHGETLRGIPCQMQAFTNPLPFLRLQLFESVVSVFFPRVTSTPGEEDKSQGTLPPPSMREEQFCGGSVGFGS